MSNNCPAGAGCTPTSANAATINRTAGDAETQAGMDSKVRSPFHSTEGGNYKYVDAPSGWGGNVERSTDPAKGTHETG
jgi:hypothetical protein